MNSPHDFDLLSDRWIPVQRLNGNPDEISLKEALCRAPLLARIVDPSPLVTFGIHRFLGAVLHRYLDIVDENGWADLWEAGEFPEEFFVRLEARCSGRLRLFDPDRPFLQSGDILLDAKPDEPLKSVGYLAPEASTGTNVAHFSHAGEARHAFCPVCCAKGLLQMPCFATAGGAGIKPGINGVPPLYLLPRGSNLFQTVMLNLLLPAYRGELAAGPDPGPLWESETCVAARTELSSTGFVESLTWPPRRVRLFPGEGGNCSRCGHPSDTLVRRMVFSQGWSRERSLPLWRDGWVAYERRQKKGEDQPELVPLRPREDRDVWRDFPGLFLQYDRNANLRPLLLEQIAALIQTACLRADTTITYELFGLRTDMKAKIFEWRQESFLFPPGLLHNRYVSETLRTELQYADHVAQALRTGLRGLFPERQFSTLDPLVHGALRSYWLALEGRFRQQLFDPRLAGNLAERAAWADDWRDHAHRTARRALDAARENFDATADSLRRQVRARDRFHAALAGWKGGPK
jgi:CRISPR system Cascade subunit CasA